MISNDQNRNEFLLFRLPVRRELPVFAATLIKVSVLHIYCNSLGLGCWEDPGRGPTTVDLMVAFTAT